MSPLTVRNRLICGRSGVSSAVVDKKHQSCGAADCKDMCMVFRYLTRWLENLKWHTLHKAIAPGAHRHWCNQLDEISHIVSVG